MNTILILSSIMLLASTILTWDAYSKFQKAAAYYRMAARFYDESVKLIHSIHEKKLDAPQASS